MDPFPSEEIRLAFIAFFFLIRLCVRYIFSPKLNGCLNFPSLFVESTATCNLSSLRILVFFLLFHQGAYIETYSLGKKNGASKTSLPPHKKKNRIETPPLLSTWSDSPMPIELSS